MSMKPQWKRFLMQRSRGLHSLTLLGALLVSVLLGTLISPLQLLQAAFIEGEGGAEVLIPTFRITPFILVNIQR